MKLFDYLDRISRVHRMVEKHATGTPDEFAHCLGVSRTTLYQLIDELRLRGAPIVYSKSAKTFYYSKPFDITVTCSIKPLTQNEAKDFMGGRIYLPEYFFSGRCIAKFAG